MQHAQIPHNACTEVPVMTFWSFTVKNGNNFSSLYIHAYRWCLDSLGEHHTVAKCHILCKAAVIKCIQLKLALKVCTLVTYKWKDKSIKIKQQMHELLVCFCSQITDMYIIPRPELAQFKKNLKIKDCCPLVKKYVPIQLSTLLLGKALYHTLQLLLPYA